MNHLLVIGGTDPTSGAGVQADIKTLYMLGIRAYSVVSVITVQNSKGFYNIFPLAPEIIEKQIKAVFEDTTISHVKLGMLYSPSIIETIAKFLKKNLSQ